MASHEGLSDADIDFRAHTPTSNLGVTEAQSGVLDTSHIEDAGTGPFYIDVYKNRKGERTLEIHRRGTEAEYLHAYNYLPGKRTEHDDGSIEELGTFFVPPTRHGLPNVDGWQANEHIITTRSILMKGVDPMIEIIPPMPVSLPKQEEVILMAAD
jgi:hypothetical protein